MSRRSQALTPSKELFTGEPLVQPVAFATLPMAQGLGYKKCGVCDCLYSINDCLAGDFQR